MTPIVTSTRARLVLVAAILCIASTTCYVFGFLKAITDLLIVMIVTSAVAAVVLSLTIAAHWIDEKAVRHERESRNGRARSRD